jgi:hypothetical protein
MPSHCAFMIYKYTYITGVKKMLLKVPFIILRFINIDNYFAFSIFKQSSNYLYLKNKFISFFFYTMYVYKYLNKINTFTMRNYYTSCKRLDIYWHDNYTHNEWLVTYLQSKTFCLIDSN